MTAHSLFLVLHILSNLVWIGSIAAVGLLIAKSAAMEGAARVAVAGGARSIYRTLAAPSFGLSFIFGIALLAGDPSGYFKQHWFHAKLTAALVVIALHHVIGGRAKRAEAGTLAGDGGAPVLTLVLLVAAAGAVGAVVLKP